MIKSSSALNYIVAVLLKYARMYKYACGFPLLSPHISLHNRILKFGAILILLTTNANAAQDIGQPENVESVTVLVSSSMTTPISEISRQYSREKAVDLNDVFEAPSELVAKIEDGDPADVIIVSDQKWLDKLQEQGLIEPSSRVKIAGNRLSLVTSKDFKLSEDSKQLEQVLDFIHTRTLMVMGDPSLNTLGARTKEVLQNVKKWDKFKSFIVLAPTSAKTVDLLIKSQSAGIIYSTDAKLFKDKLHYVGDIPEKLHKPVEYYAAVVLGNNMDEAQKFLLYLISKPAQDILKKAGFVVK